MIFSIYQRTCVKYLIRRHSVPLTSTLVRNKGILTLKKSKSKENLDLSYASYERTESVLEDAKTQLKSYPLIVLHGLLGSKLNFNKACLNINEKTNPSRKVYSVDFRNHGDSPYFASHTYDDLVLDLNRFLNTMDLKKVALLGHDMGGRVSMLFALKYPELVEKLVICDISPISTSQSFKAMPAILRSLQHLMLPQGIPLSEARSLVIGHLLNIVNCKSILSLVLSNLVQRPDKSFAWRFNLKTLFKNCEHLSIFPELHNVTFNGPVLFIGGAKSDYIQKSDYSKILKLFPNAELKYIEGAGHWLHSEKPNEFLKLTLDFLNKNVRS